MFSEIGLLAEKPAARLTTDFLVHAEVEAAGKPVVSLTKAGRQV